MRYRTLGKTGLTVSLIGVGTGGPSQFGQASGVAEAEAARTLRRALDLGINFIDSSSQYGDSEAMLGRMLADVPRLDYCLATKFASSIDGRVPAPAEVLASVEGSLDRLGIDTIDVLQFHGVIPTEYDRVIDSLMPTALKLVEQGKCRFLGLSENYSRDHQHATISRALEADVFDTYMVAYSLLTPSAEDLVLNQCRERNVGVIDMVAVRRGLSRPEHLRNRLQDAVERGIVAEEVLDGIEPLSWLVGGHVSSLPAAGYKFAAAHPAVSTVLSGTADTAHLEENVAAVCGPPLSDDAMARIRRLFGSVRENLGD